MKKDDTLYGRMWGWCGIAFVLAMILVGHCSCTQRVVEVKEVYVAMDKDTGTRMCPKCGNEQMLLFTKKPKR